MCQFLNFNILLLITLVVIPIASSEDRNNKLIKKSVIVRSFDDIEIEGDRNDPCKSISTEMPDFRAPGRRVSEVKCFEHVWRAKLHMTIADRQIDCDIQSRRLFAVLGGHNANLSDFAHMGALGWEALDGTWMFRCGGSLISNKFVLTAAHCSSASRIDTTVKHFQPRIVRLGVVTVNRDKFVFKKESAIPTDANIKRIVKHPLYRAPRRYYDIALIELKKEIDFKWLVHPSCLHTSFDVPETATVTGWGIINLVTQKTASTLQVADLDIIESLNCDYLLRSRLSRHWKGVAQHQLCAGHLAGGIDACQGDSGGPLQYMIGKKLTGFRHPNTWTVHRIVGITSFGHGCAKVNTPGVYTRVASFTDWIEKIVWPDDYRNYSRIIFPNDLRTRT